MQTVMINQAGYASDFHAVIYAPLEWQRQGLTKTRSGYGTKIPTTKMIKFEGRNRRIYVDQYGNAGSTYIIVKGEKVHVS